ncbi:MAG: HEPN domain-containing protein [Coriobacteriia bacterium]|nr:HEPN domain-containing protein [Coriobacteriia bacterium]MCL2750563.1 HEPN domain-containing protein [Coriobacteriia bacterium]
MSKPTRTRQATNEGGQIALQKAQQFLATAQEAFDSERWDSAGLNAIHAGINAADAVLAAVAGIRSADQKHEKVSILLTQNVPSFSERQRSQLIGLLKMKNTVAYEQRLITKVEAQRLVQAAKRFLAWAQQNCS